MFCLKSLPCFGNFTLNSLINGFHTIFLIYCFDMYAPVYPCLEGSVRHREIVKKIGGKEPYVITSVRFYIMYMWICDKLLLLLHWLTMSSRLFFDPLSSINEEFQVRMSVVLVQHSPKKKTEPLGEGNTWE